MEISLYSWNVNGLRAVAQRGFLEWLAQSRPTILGIQETKATPDQLSSELTQPDGYSTYWASSTAKKGYSGVGLFTQMQPQSVETGLGIDEFDVEGRTIIAHYEQFTFITAYFPNGSRDHSRVPYKMQYKAAFLKKINALRAEGKRVIFCGDVNTSHHPIDIARPKENETKTGFMPIERVWLDEVIQAGYIDIYRHLNPQKTGAYTWWSYMGGARARNVGWRLDYFFISPDLLPHVANAGIHPDIEGSDHCPVSLTLRF